jgi:hypothetical protein
MTDRLLAGATVMIALSFALAVESGADWLARFLALTVVALTVARGVLA